MTFQFIRSATAVTLASLLMAAQPQRAGAHVMDRSVTVSASATIRAKPDTARVQTGVVTEDATAQAALAANTQAMANVIDGLRSLGVEAKDIQTTNFAVNPRYNHNRDGHPPKLAGYHVTNEVTVIIRDLDKLGEILDKIISLGSNQMRGLGFEVSNAETLIDSARTQAINNARRRAKLIAKAAGAELGEVLVIREGATAIDGPRPVFETTRTAPQAVPIESGQQSLSATVTVTWALD